MSGAEYNRNLPTTVEQYLEEELHPKLSRMAIKASFSKRMFFTLRTLAILGGVLLPILVSLNKDEKYIQGLSIVISIIVTLSIALEESLKFKEQYIKLESLINVANKLKVDFISGENEFLNLTEEQKIKKFASLSGSVILNSQNSLLEAFSNMESPRTK
jgi:hypothetical protein